MALLRRPQTNVRMIQVHGLLQYAYLQDFLTEANPQIATEIWNVYIESMSKVSQKRAGFGGSFDLNIVTNTIPLFRKDSIHSFQDLPVAIAATRCH
jgi:hypothetical protein